MTKEEYASKLHLLQQEYDKLNDQHHRLMADYDVESDARGEKEEHFDALKKEYDKLKGEKADWLDIAGTASKKYNELWVEHAALKAKVDKMEAMLRDIRKNARLSIRLETEIDDCLPDNSNTNQNENNG